MQLCRLSIDKCQFHKSTQLFHFGSSCQMLKNLLDACGAGIAFYAVGYGFAYGHDGETNESTFIGKCNFFLAQDESPSLFFFQYAFSATCVTIIAGTLAERCQMSAYLAYSLYLTGFVYPVVVHNICTYCNKGKDSSVPLRQ